jgi:valyl-tRNA synthetase
VIAGFTNYDMDDSARALYEFLWNEYCDWYIELAKPRLRGEPSERAQVQAVLCHVLETTLRLMHPVMPFITEEIWQALPHEGESIMIAPFPASDAGLFDDEAEEWMRVWSEEARLEREMKAAHRIPVRKATPMIVAGPTKSSRVFFVPRFGEDERRFVERCAGTTLQWQPSPPMNIQDYSVATSPVTGLMHCLPRPEQDDATTAKELARIDSRLASIEKELARSNGKLSNEQFTARAPAELVDRERRIVAELEEEKRAKLEERNRWLGV